MSDKIIYGVIGLLIGVIIAWPVVSTAAGYQHMNMMQKTMGDGDMMTGMMGEISPNSELHDSHHPDIGA